jgi:hypothetical protein
VTLDPGYFRDLCTVSLDPYGLAGNWYKAGQHARLAGGPESVAQSGGIA